MLGKWKEANDNRRPADAPDMPESLSRAMRQLWAVAWNETQNGIKADREALEAAGRAFDASGKAATALSIENARLDERAKAAESRADDLKQELAQLHARFQELAARPAEAILSAASEDSAPRKTRTQKKDDTCQK